MKKADIYKELSKMRAVAEAHCFEHGMAAPEEMTAFMKGYALALTNLERRIRDWKEGVLLTVV